jgi:serine O-acetyltransferase
MGEERPTFQPYGVDPDVSDPVARALTGLLDEVATLRARINELEAERARPAAPVEAPAPAPESSRRRVARANP